MTTDRSIRRWGGAATVATLLVALGVGTLNATVFVAAIPPAVFVLYSVATGVREPAPTIDIARSLEPDTPQPGSDVTVTLTVENETDKPLPDVRIADGVPPELVVTDGSPRAALALSPGQSEEISYTVAVSRGRYEFDDPTVRTRSLAASTTVTDTVEADGDRELEASFTAGDVELAQRTMPFAGAISVDTSGAGIEFHSTREYEPGDAVSRINWRDFAKRDELSTVDYHVQESARIVVAVDARTPSRVARTKSTPSGADLAAYVGTHAVAALLDVGHRVGLVGLGVPHEDSDVPVVAYRAPGSETGTIARMDAIVDAVTDGEPLPSTAVQALGPAGGESPADIARQAIAQFPGDAQVLFVSALEDDAPVEMARLFEAYGHDTVVVAPNVSQTRTLGGRLAALRRTHRVEDLRRAGIPVTDWQPDRPLSVALSESAEGGTRRNRSPGKPSGGEQA